MQLLTRELTVGEDLGIEIDRSEYRNRFHHLADALKTHEDAARSTYELLLKLETVPSPTTGPNRKVRRRLYLVCVAVGVDPARYGLTSDDRAANWPGDQLLVKQIRHDCETLSVHCVLGSDISDLELRFNLRESYGDRGLRATG